MTRDVELWRLRDVLVQYIKARIAWAIWYPESGWTL
jgi:hypothetical protein